MRPIGEIFIDIFARLCHVKYRIIIDNEFGYHVQCRPVFWPFWTPCYNGNSHSNLESAELMIKNHKAGLDRWGEEIDPPKVAGTVVKTYD